MNTQTAAVAVASGGRPPYRRGAPIISGPPGPKRPAQVPIGDLLNHSPHAQLQLSLIHI